MARKITLEVSAVASLLERYYPNPDDSDPVGPWGPVIRYIAEYMKALALHPDPWRLSGPLAFPLSVAAALPVAIPLALPVAPAARPARRHSPGLG